MIKSSKAFGVMPEDLLVGGAISKALEDLKKNPYLLDYCFNWLSIDPLTKGLYGDKEKETIKKWFLNTMFYVSPSTLREDEIRFPLIAIHLESSTEDAATMSDTHYETFDEIPQESAGEVRVQPNIILGPFTPKTYDSVNGIIELPSNLTTESLFVDYILVDNINKQGYPIISIESSTTFKIAENTSANFTDAYIAPIDTFTTIALESVVFKQIYSINCFIQNEPKHIMYLSAIIRFILLRYREYYLEDRGFENSYMSMTGPFVANNDFPNTPEGEMIFGQKFTLTGIVRETWPKMINPKIQGIKINGIEYLGGTQTPDGYINQVSEQCWWQVDDPLPE